MSEVREGAKGEQPPSKAVTVNWDSMGKPRAEHRLDISPGEAGDSRAVTVNWDPGAKHHWEFRPPGPETEKLRPFIKRRLPEQHPPMDENK